MQNSETKTTSGLTNTPSHRQGLCPRTRLLTQGTMVSQCTVCYITETEG